MNWAQRTANAEHVLKAQSGQRRGWAFCLPKEKWGNVFRKLK